MRNTPDYEHAPAVTLPFRDHAVTLLAGQRRPDQRGEDFLRQPGVDADLLGPGAAPVDHDLLPGEIARRRTVRPFAKSDFADDPLAFRDQVDDLPIDVGQRIA